ncbi:hypothetical protein SAMN03080615_00812 [Amphritea atlantica]|uniref:Uncharacterized protein n=1 Tax=Amphritea atlantica TaxID=355243 RepID=A0A1H9EBQ6_9GAMM|nr:hypothetical protein [Amphritea atlantica]SEQ23075.1 hypothetical protein SAMN03080615_00812 [Amphritea atlantica]
MWYRALLILLLSVMAVNPAISAGVPVVASHSQMGCHGDNCDMHSVEMTGAVLNSADCCDAELPDCCLQLAALFMMPTGFQSISSSQIQPGWSLSGYLSAIPPPLYHPPRPMRQSV